MTQQGCVGVLGPSHDTAGYWVLVMIQQGCVGVLGPSHDTAGVCGCIGP